MIIFYFVVYRVVTNAVARKQLKITVGIKNFLFLYVRLTVCSSVYHSGRACVCHEPWQLLQLTRRSSLFLAKGARQRSHSHGFFKTMGLRTGRAQHNKAEQWASFCDFMLVNNAIQLFFSKSSFSLFWSYSNEAGTANRHIIGRLQFPLWVKVDYLCGKQQE